MILTSLARFCLDHQLEGERDNELYMEALRVLSAATGEHRVDIGGLQILYWSDSPEGDWFLSGALGAVGDYWYYRTSPGVRAWLDRLDSGELSDPRPANGVFHVLGVSQSESSPVIGFWISDTFRGLTDRIRAFWDDLHFASAGRPTVAAILHMVREAASAEDFEQIAPRLTEDLLRGMLSGAEFPPRLLQAVVDRIRKDGVVDGRRAAVLKALLGRRARLSGSGRAAPAELDPAAPDPDYRLGRLYAVFDALWSLAPGWPWPTAFFRSLVASAPGPTTLGLSSLARLKLACVKPKDRPAAAALAQEMDQLLASLDRRLPSHLSVEHHARFALGLHQQRQSMARIG